jgi:ubiquitin C-terminal hydrolase
MNNNNSKFNNNINENIMNNQVNNQTNNPNFNININQINQNVENNKIISNQTNNYSFSRYTKASQTALVNIYDTSYLNSVLQLLGSIRNIASYFLNPKHQKIIVDDIKHYPLSFVFYRLFLHLYPYPEIDNKEIYKPDSLLEVLGILNVVYKTTKARNPNELISFILNTLHKEININKNNKFQPPNYNIYDKKSVINAGISYFQKSDNSVISNILNWFEIKELRCNKCNQIVYNFNTFNTFELDILGAYQCKKNPITLNECLYYYGKEKLQELYCIKCGKYNKITYKSNILSSSYMIIFSLNRGELDKNNLIHIPFHLEDKIDLSFFIEKESPKHYELTGIVSIVKEQNKYKYVSFCRSPVDHQWYLYNDLIIEKPQLNDVINAHNNNKYIPCILAYTQY